MAKSVSYNKREIEKKKQNKRLEKQQRKEERKANKGNGTFEEMIAYVDENGMITDTPPDITGKPEIEAKNIPVSTPPRETEEDPLYQGRIEYFNPDKGYGFIKAKENAEKYFFHITQALTPITEGDPVTFETERGPKGINAVKITAVK